MEMQRQAQIMLVDDHPIVRDGLHQMIERDAALYVCGEAGSADEALRKIAQTQPDLVSVDVFLDGINGIELTKMLTEKYPGIRILILSMHDEALYAERALRAGAMGYVMKQAPSKIILQAIHTVLAGERYVSESLRDLLGDERKQGGPDQTVFPADVASILTSRELHIFRALGEGLDRNAIAATFNISTKTVETHRANIKNKLNISRSDDVTKIARKWLEQGEVQENGATV